MNNYIIFFPDELRAETVSMYGNTKIKTPNFERLAKEGVRFDQCHVQNSVCSPSRCSLFTGQYVHTAGHRSLWNLLKPHEHNLFRYLKEAGWEVRIYGKNDLFSNEAVSLSADVFENKPGLGENPKPAASNEEQGNCMLFSPMEGDYTHHSDYQNLKAGMDFIRGRKAGDKPFILFLPLLFPHCPYTAHEPFYSMYGEGDIMPLRPACENKPMYHELIRQYRGLEKASLEKIQAVYMGMTSFIDTLLGELMDCVEQTGIKDKTMLIAAADHGDYAGDYGLIEKWPSGCEDVLTRVPLIISGPGCKQNTVSRESVELFDITATILEDTGITARHTMYARSLWPQLRGGAGDPDRMVFCEGGYNKNEPHCNEGYPQGSRPFLRIPGSIYQPKGLQQWEHPESVGRAVMIRTKSHKLVLRTYGDHEFYDLEKDPLELNNVYGTACYIPAQKDTERRLLDWYIATSDSVPTEADSRF
ncbi:MAG: sulfatase-like hydrolase/transferase [Treponema sp.]|jgi:choline-sulfatase|nr:sulfatase-like hydrolase/transferase [Treponema sp.]